MIVQVGQAEIDISKVIIVGPTGGDKSSLRYSVVFAGGYTIEVMEERKDCVCQMPRSKFVELWKQAVPGQNYDAKANP